MPKLWAIRSRWPSVLSNIGEVIKTIKKLWQWCSSAKIAKSKPRYLHQAEHSIANAQISKNALTVLETLQKAGFHAYLVGGSVRDLLMGISPKDFDVATNARPEQVKKLFRHCRLIGKRFRLAHVVFGRDIIEVATFRKSAGKGKRHLRTNGNGMLVSDNCYGRLQDDVWRRDFTVNALYYDAKESRITDYVGGVKDLIQGEFRIMGNPEKRYREDPVRMLRAIRLMSKLSLMPDKTTEAPLPTMAHLLGEISPTRLFEELLKMLYRGKAEDNIQLMADYGILPYLLPVAASVIKRDGELSPLSQLAIKNTDDRIIHGMSINPAFLLSVLLWEHLQKREKAFLIQKYRPAAALRMAMDAVMSDQLQVTSIPKRITQMMMEIWRMQYPLESLRHKQADALVTQKRFRAAYDFLLLRAQAGESVQEAADWWTRYQSVDLNEREAMVEAVSSTVKSTPSKKHKRVSS